MFNFQKWVRGILGTAPSTALRRPIQNSRAHRPQLEALEDRWCPSTYQVTNNLDDGSVGSLRWAVSQVNADPDTLQGDIIQFAGSLSGGQNIILGSTLTINAASTSLTITDEASAPVTISGNKAVQVINSSRDLVLDNLTIANGAAVNGAGIYDTLSLVAENCSFSDDVTNNPSGPAAGGAIYAGTVSATSCFFSNDSTTGAYGTFAVNGGGFNDDASGAGGAIFADSVTAAGCTFVNTLAAGPGVYYQPGTNAIFVGLGSGGAIYSTTAAITNCTFTGDFATGRANAFGGALFTTNTTVVDDCSFSNDTVSNAAFSGGISFGGAICANSSLSATGCTFSNDSASSPTEASTARGGAIGSLNGPSLVVTTTNCTFVNDSAIAGSLAIDPNYNTGSCYAEGGAIFALTITATNSTFSGDSTTASTYGPNRVNSGVTATSEGGALYAWNDATATNCVFSSNSANYSHTLSNASGSGEGGAFFTSSASSADNCLFFNNSATSSGNDYSGNVTASACVVGLDPLLGTLQNNGGPTATMALATNSPAINAGTASGAPLVDQRGYVRDSQPDIGAYEVSTTTPVITISSGSGGQSATGGAAFANALGVTVTTPGGTPIPNYTLTLQAPTSGPSGTFANSATTAVLTTDANGDASAAFTANLIAGGPYTVTGDGGLGGDFDFTLTNLTPSLVVVDTVDFTIAGNAAEVFGVPFMHSLAGNVAVFTILGDLDIPPGDTITAHGPYAVEFMVGNNVSIPSTATFDFAATGQEGGASGGGAGGSLGSGGLATEPATGGMGGSVGDAGAGGQNVITVSGING